MSASSGSMTFGTAPVTLLTTPPGPVSILFTTLAGTAYIGLDGGTGVTVSNGYPLPATLQVPYSLRPSDPPVTIAAVGGGSPTTVSWAVTTAQ